MNTNFDEISEGASDEEINLNIKAFLNEKDDLINKNGINYALRILMKIAEHETINEYEMADISEISKFIENHIDFNDVSSIDYILSIAIMMHLETVWNKIITANNIKNQKVIALIDDAQKENEEFKYFI